MAEGQGKLRYVAGFFIMVGLLVATSSGTCTVLFGLANMHTAKHTLFQGPALIPFGVWGGSLTCGAGLGLAGLAWAEITLPARAGSDGSSKAGRATDGAFGTAFALIAGIMGGTGLVTIAAALYLAPSAVGAWAAAIAATVFGLPAWIFSVIARRFWRRAKWPPAPEVAPK
jgi:hypothetical protein